MSKTVEQIVNFVNYASTLSGDEKGEAQVFCDRLFQGFGHCGYKEAGATLEHRVKKSTGISFADLLWRPRVLIEMKRRGEKLQNHYRQAFEYWIHLVPGRPKYVILCNFDEFWIYDFNVQLDEPVDKVRISELKERYTSLNFLFPEERKPQFGNDRVAVTRTAADKVAQVFNSLIERGENRESAQRFILQCVVAMFAEDFDLLRPKGIFLDLLEECRSGQSSYDLIGGLFRQMNSPTKAKGGRYAEVDYFNGGLFKNVEAMQLSVSEIDLLASAAEENWSKVAPPIFGTLFQSSMGKERRHALGAHFTNEADIQKVVLPTIVRPWRERIGNANSLKELLNLGSEVLKYKVLDPACGSGNFLYVAYRELMKIEMDILYKIFDKFGKRGLNQASTASLVSSTQFYGIDIDEFAVELAKITLMLGKRLALSETRDSWFSDKGYLPLEFESALPLDNLDKNIFACDALFTSWPKVDAIVGNPPYQAKNKMVEEFGREYVDRVREKFPDVPGRADYCVYWFRKAHDSIPKKSRVGLVGTNTIRQNYSREGGLDYITQNGGVITEAVSNQVWSGDAVVHVSIVNWIKGSHDGPKKLFTQNGDFVDSPWSVEERQVISSSLTSNFDVSNAKVLRINVNSEICYQGQTHGHKGFLLDHDTAKMLLSKIESKPVVFPYLTGDDLLGIGKPSRFVIDLSDEDDLHGAMKYELAFERIRELVMPSILAKAQEEATSTGRNIGPRQNHAKKWWKFWRGRKEMLARVRAIPRYIACSRVTRRPIFCFVDSSINPNDALQVFALADDYSFGILQSSMHWDWFTERCSTLKADYRYTSETVYSSFPWPQNATVKNIKNVAEASRELRSQRKSLMDRFGWSLRDLYRSLDVPGVNALETKQKDLDNAVRLAYGMKKNDSSLEFLYKLNARVAAAEVNGESVVGPGIPPVAVGLGDLFSDDRVMP